MVDYSQPFALKVGDRATIEVLIKFLPGAIFVAERLEITEHTVFVAVKLQLEAMRQLLSRDQLLVALQVMKTAERVFGPIKSQLLPEGWHRQGESFLFW